MNKYKAVKFIINQLSVFFKSKRKNYWAEDNFIFEQPSGKQVATPQSTTHIGSSFSENKALAFSVCIFFIFLTIVCRLFYLQIIKGRNYIEIAQGNREKSIPIVAERGYFFDRNNIQLTENIPNFSLAIMPHKLPRDENSLRYIIDRLSDITGKPKEEIEKIIDDFASYRYESIVISENLDYETALQIQIAASDLPGIHIQRGSKRLYILDEKDNENPKWLSASHLLGYQSKLNKSDLETLYSQGYLPSDYIGKTGLEKQYETILRGTYGQTLLEVNALGKEQTVLSEIAPIPGKHIRLTIDIDIQRKLEEVVSEAIVKTDKKRAAVIALNPNNGEILALVSLPSFNNNDFSGGIDFETYKKYTEDEDHPLFNRALAGSYPSGSTIKPAIAASALQEGIINQNTSFLSTGGISVDPWFFPDWQAGGHGSTNVRKSIAWSVNTFYYYIGGGYKNFTGLGVDKITNYLRLFGFDDYLGVDLPGENKGFLPSKKWKEETKGERWYIGDTYNISIGQGDVLVTPLQIASMTAIVANNGTLYKPHMLKAVIDPKSFKEDVKKVEIIRKDIVASQHLKTVALGMKDCVDYGSCQRLKSLPMQAAGKTGTAQWSTNKDPHAWFTSFAPFQNPQIVVTLLIEEGESGSNAAIPAIEKFYQWWWAEKAK